MPGRKRSSTPGSPVAIPSPNPRLTPASRRQATASAAAPQAVSQPRKGAVGESGGTRSVKVRSRRSAVACVAAAGSVAVLGTSATKVAPRPSSDDLVTLGHVHRLPTRGRSQSPGLTRVAGRGRECVVPRPHHPADAARVHGAVGVGLRRPGGGGGRRPAADLRELAAEITRAAHALRASGVGPGRPGGVPVRRTAASCWSPTSPRRWPVPCWWPSTRASRPRRCGRSASTRARACWSPTPRWRAPSRRSSDRLGDVREVVWAGPGAPAAVPGPGYAEFLARGVRRSAAVDGRGRGRHDLDQLHVGHDGRARRASCTPTAAGT